MQTQTTGSGSSPAFDIDSFLEPIPGASPAGEELRYEGAYDQIQESRREDDPNLEQGVWKTKIKKADWLAAQKTCAESLKTRTKDLQIAAWLTEAWTQLHGYAGLHFGLVLMSKLCDRFWEDLHPEIQDDGFEFRTSPFLWINEKLSLKLKLVPITRPADPDAPSYTLADWEQANRLENFSKREGKGKSALDEDRVTTDKFIASAANTPVELFSQAVLEIDATVEESNALEAFLDEKCGKDAPGFSLLRKNLEAIKNLMLELGGETLQKDLSPEPAKAPEPETGAGQPQAPETENHEMTASESKTMAMAAPAKPIANVGAITTREEAYQALSLAAEFLIQTEPHSPAPYLVKRAVTWGDKNLNDLLKELIHDPNNLGSLLELLGMDVSQLEE